MKAHVVITSTTAVTTAPSFLAPPFLPRLMRNTRKMAVIIPLRLLVKMSAEIATAVYAIRPTFKKVRHLLDDPAETSSRRVQRK
jgi:hypothetical protein